MSDCASKGAMANIYAVTARRYPIVDEEAGVVLGLGVFERKPGVAMRRNMLSEWFVIEQGKIRWIYSSMFYPERGHGAELAAFRRQLAGSAAAEVAGWA